LPPINLLRKTEIKIKADLVITNGKVITVDKDFSIKKAVAVKMAKFWLPAPLVKGELSGIIKT
jgi:hypothetical protein